MTHDEQSPLGAWRAFARRRAPGAAGAAGTLLAALAAAGCGDREPTGLLGQAAHPGTPLAVFSNRSYDRLAWVWSADGAELVYADREDAAATIRAVPAGGGPVRTVVAPPGQGRAVAPGALHASPDNRSVYYLVLAATAAGASGDPTTGDLYRAPVRGAGAPEPVAPGVFYVRGGTAFAVAPGTGVVAATAPGAARGFELIDPRTGARATVGPPPTASGTGLGLSKDRFAWAPDGSGLVASDDGAADVRWLDFRGTATLAERYAAAVRFTLIGAGGSVCSPVEARWEAGRPVLYHTDCATLWRHDVATGARVRLGAVPAGARRLAWSPDGTQVAFWRSTCLEERTGTGITGGSVTACVRSRHTLATATIATGAEREVETFEAAGAPEDVSPPVYAPTGGAVAYTHQNPATGLTDLALYVRRPL